MKHINKLSAIAIMLIGIAMAINAAGQTLNTIAKFDNLGGTISTVTPIFEDATNSLIGIGTTSPQQKLSVSNAVNLDQSSGNTGTIGNALTFGSSSGEGIGSKRNASGNQYGLDFYTNFTNRMVITNGGNVGIGTASPNEKLEVTGNIRIGTSNAFMLAGNKFLWHNDDVTSIYAGVGAGSSTTGTSTLYNTFMGRDAGKLNTSGYYNTAIGCSTLYSNTTEYYQTAIGYQALYSYNQVAPGHTATNVACGYQALYSMQAYGGTAVGFWAARENTTGCGTTAFGEEALRENTTGYFNTAIGVAAIHSNETGSYNVCVGNGAGAGGTGYSYDENSCFGASAGLNLLTGSDNVFVGYGSGENNTHASDNVAVGHEALYSQSYGTSLWSSYNVAVGNKALYSNEPTGHGNGVHNTSVGHESFYSNTTGGANVGLGYQAGYLNTAGDYNLCVGHEAGYSNTEYYGTFVGSEAGFSHTSGLYPCFIGYSAGLSNTTGSYNTFVGLDAGYANTTGDENSGLGLQVLGQTTTGRYNTGLGYRAGYAITTGSENTFVGNTADASAAGSAFTNCGAFGYGAITSASAKYVIGNTAVTVIGGQVGWSTLSDSRFKINVTENVPGLDFINRLRPITYNLNTMALDSFLHQNTPQAMDSSNNPISSPAGDFTSSTNIVHSGFIAQEVEEASQQSSFTSSIINAPANTSDPYSMNYAELVVPLVKAVQQLDSINHVIQTQIDSLINATQPQQLHQNPGDDGNNINEHSIDVRLESKTIVLNQNEPNPFKENTIIEYFIPDDASNVKIIFTDNRGSVLKEVEIQEKGKGQLNVYASDLSSGIYTYTIVADGVSLDSKRMVKTK